MIGEQPLQIVLHQRVEHAHDAGDAGESEHQHAPPPGGIAEEIEHDAHEGVDRDLGHDAAQKTRDVARRRRVGKRQPGMQRHETRLRAGADQHKNENECDERWRVLALADRIEDESPVRPGEQAEGEQKREGAEARHDQIDIARAQILAHLIVRHHQRPGGERHELPGEQEGEGIVGDDHEGHACEEQRIEGQHALRRRFMPPEAERVEARRAPADIDHHEEERRERVETEMRADPGKAERQGQGLCRCLSDQRAETNEKAHASDRERYPIDQVAAEGRGMEHKRKRGNDEKEGDGGKDDGERHRLARL